MQPIFAYQRPEQDVRERLIIGGASEAAGKLERTDGLLRKGALDIFGTIPPRLEHVVSKAVSELHGNAQGSSARLDTLRHESGTIRPRTGYASEGRTLDWSVVKKVIRNHQVASLSFGRGRKRYGRCISRLSE